MPLPTLQDKPVRQARTIVFAQFIELFYPEFKLQLNHMGHSSWVSLDSTTDLVPEPWMHQLLCLYQWEFCEVLSASKT